MLMRYPGMTYTGRGGTQRGYMLGGEGSGGGQMRHSEGRVYAG